MKLGLFLCALLLRPALALPADEPKEFPALKNAIILVIRHAEKPDSGPGLSPPGEQRAQLYVDYFKKFTLDSTPLKIDSIFAAADSKASSRPRLTIEPTAKALSLTIDNRFKDKEFKELADELRSKPHGHVILVAWHHGEIPELVHALGADSAKLILDDKWPSDVFGWVIALRYDEKGQLVDAKRINENLLPDDSDKKASKP